MWADEVGLSSVFEDIEQLAHECRFKDCTHRSELGCAVKTAIRQGSLDADRLQSYRKLEKELRHLAARQEGRTRLEEREKWRKVSQWARRNQRDNQIEPHDG